MESKHKNALIGALLAVVFVMAVGYAAFAQLLTINGTATIDSSWDVHFDPAQTTSTAIACHTGVGTSSNVCGSDATGNVDPYGTIAYDSTPEKPTVANLTANLKQPNDTVTFTLKPTNYGSLAAKPAEKPVITSADNEVVVAADGQSATKGNIKWEIVSDGTTVSTEHTLPAGNSETPADTSKDTIIVRASFYSGQTGPVESGQTASIKIEINYQQA